MNAVATPDVHSPAMIRPWSLSVVIPARNAVRTLPGTLARLERLPGGAPHEIIVVENGSRDGTRELLERLRRDWRQESRLVVLHSEKGIGAAYRAGVSASHGNRVLLTADDLPFGTSDIRAVLACRALPRFAIGSAAHPRSRVRRSLMRRMATTAFRLSRNAVLGLKVGDTQGTFVIEGQLARRLVAGTTIRGFGMTTELVALAAREGTSPVELPVVLSRRASGTSRLRWISGRGRMVLDLLRLRLRLGAMRTVVVLPDEVHAG
jgi:dolichyl-phosphate beta-glucosyltransferase